MAIQKIITVPNPTLRQKAKSVALPAGRLGKIDKKTLKIIKDLKDTLQAQKEPKGVGLSAPQIGQPWQICLVAPPKAKGTLALINPQITWRAKEVSPTTAEDKNPFEGCLSVPGIWGVVKRPKRVKVRYLSLQGKSQTKSFVGLGAVAVQHEIDHLNGILFIDRILKQKDKLYRIEKNNEGKEELVEVKLD